MTVIIIIAGSLFGLYGLYLLHVSKNFKENLWEAAVGTITNTSIEAISKGSGANTTVQYYPNISYEYTVDGKIYYPSIPIKKLNYYHEEALQEHLNESYKIGGNIDILYNINRKDLSRIKQDYEYAGVNVEFTVKRRSIKFLSIGIILIAGGIAWPFLLKMVMPQLTQWENYWLIILGSIFLLTGAASLIKHINKKSFYNKDKWEASVGIIRDIHISKAMEREQSDDRYRTAFFYPKISYEYVLDGIKYYSWYVFERADREEDAQKALQGYKIGENIDISYKKNKPAITQIKNDLNAKKPNSYIMGIVYLSIGIIAIAAHFVWPLLWNR